MFKRALQVKVVKSTKEEPTEKIDKEALYECVADAAGKVVQKIAMGALAYVAVDTARQVLVARAIQR